MVTYATASDPGCLNVRHGHDTEHRRFLFTLLCGGRDKLRAEWRCGDFRRRRSGGRVLHLSGGFGSTLTARRGSGSGGTPALPSEKREGGQVDADDGGNRRRT